jgi:hypothetical protein
VGRPTHAGGRWPRARPAWLSQHLPDDLAAATSTHAAPVEGPAADAVAAVPRGHCGIVGRQRGVGAYDAARVAEAVGIPPCGQLGGGRGPDERKVKGHR